MDISKDNLNTRHHGRDKVGQILGGKYRIDAELGSGGMGVVYSVTQIFLNRTYALKTLDTEVPSEFLIRRFQQEAKATSLLEHPSLVQLHDFGLLDSGQPYLVMDFVDGATVAEYLKENGPMPVEQALATFKLICQGLVAAHHKGVIHRDMKPSNIMLVRGIKPGAEGSVKILDFGIAKIAAANNAEIQALTRTNEIFGSPLYMSPEQCQGTAVDSRADIYSLGCVFYEMLTGTPPHVGATALNTMVMHQKNNAPSLKEASLGRDFPVAVEQIIDRMLQKSPADRYQNLDDVINDIAALAGGKNVDPQTSERKKVKQTEADASPQIVTLSKCSFIAYSAALVLGTSLTTGFALYLIPKVSTPTNEKVASSSEKVSPAGNTQVDSNLTPKTAATVGVFPTVDQLDAFNSKPAESRPSQPVVAAPNKIFEELQKLQTSNAPNSTKIHTLESLLARIKKNGRGPAAMLAVCCALVDSRRIAGTVGVDDLNNLEYCLALAQKERSDNLVALSLIKLSLIRSLIDKDSRKTQITFDQAEDAISNTKLYPNRAEFEMVRLEWIASRAPSDLDTAIGDVARIFSKLPQSAINPNILETFYLIVKAQKNISEPTATALAEMLSVRLQQLPADTSPKSTYLFIANVKARKKPAEAVAFISQALSDSRLGNLERANMIHNLVGFGQMSLADQLSWAERAYNLTKKEEHYAAHVVSIKLYADLSLQNKDYPKAVKLYDEGLQLDSKHLAEEKINHETQRIAELSQLRKDIIFCWSAAAKDHHDDKSLSRIALLSK